MSLWIAGVWSGGASPVRAADAINPDSALVQDFENRVAQYVQLRKNVEAKLPRLHATPSPEKIAQHQHKLQHGIQKERKTAREGDIFTPAIQQEFRRLMGFALQPGDDKRVKSSLRNSEPVHIQTNINHPYPDPGVVPLQSTPPTVLLNLPRLPDDMEYRFVNRTLLLLDSRANLVVDYMSGVGP